MKISINTNENVEEIEIHIKCTKLTPDIEKVISILSMMDMKLTGIKEEETYLLDISQILYIDTVDKKIFIYTKEDIYETKLHLYELEERLPIDFFRANKSCIINMRQIDSIKADLEGRLKVTMSNAEKLMVSRQYANEVKKRLGVGK